MLTTLHAMDVHDRGWFDGYIMNRVVIQQLQHGTVGLGEHVLRDDLTHGLHARMDEETHL